MFFNFEKEVISIEKYGILIDMINKLIIYIYVIMCVNIDKVYFLDFIFFLLIIVYEYFWFNIFCIY